MTRGSGINGGVGLPKKGVKMDKELILKTDPRNTYEKGNERVARRTEQIKKLRRMGMTYRRIAFVLDVSYGKVCRAITGNKRKYDIKKAAAYYVAHCEKKKAQSKAYRATHREATKKQRAEHYLIHRDERLAKDKKYRDTHRERISKRARCWRENHRLEIHAGNAARKAMLIGATIGNIAEITEIYRHAKEDKKVRCYLCGKLIPIGHRHVDHVLPISKGGAHRPSNLAVACDTCNLSKGAKMPEALGVLI